MTTPLRKLRSLFDLIVAVKNPLRPILDRLGLLSRPYRVALWDGAVFELRPGLGDCGSLNGAYLSGEYAPVGRPLAAGDRVIDIGANIGAFTVLAARAVGPTGQVIAAEPSAETFRQLARNLALNHLTNTVAKQVAVGETPGTATLHVAHNSVFTSLYEEIAATSPQDRVEEVAVVTIDQLIDENGWDRCDFLKLDCEGAEHGIVQGMTAATAAKIGEIAMEIHEVKGFDAAALIAKLESFGFSWRSCGAVYSFWRKP